MKELKGKERTKDGQLRFRTAAAKENPSRFCELLANVVVTASTQMNNKCEVKSQDDELTKQLFEECHRIKVAEKELQAEMGAD